MATSSRLRHPMILLLAGVVLGAMFVPALAAPLTGRDAVPKVAFVARNDIPFDALGVGPIAGALGGIVVITPSAALSAPARDALVQFDPDVVYIAGGVGALTPTVEADLAAAGDWDVRRLSGTTRDHTAQLAAAILADLGAGRPVLTSDGSTQVVGDLAIGGTVTADDLELAQPLDADLLGGLDAARFALAESDVLAVPADGTPKENGAALRAAVATLGPSSAEKDTDADFFEKVRVLELGRGTFDLGGTPLTVPRAVVLVGAGRSLTWITCSCGGGSVGAGVAAIAMGDDGELRHLRVTSTGTGSQAAVGVHVASPGSIELWDVGAAARTEDGHAQAVRGGVSVADGSRVVAFASGSGSATGIDGAGAGAQVSRSVVLAFSTSGTGRGLSMTAGGSIIVNYSEVTGSDSAIHVTGAGQGTESIEFSTLQTFGSHHLRAATDRTYELRHVVLRGTAHLIANGGTITCFGVVDTSTGTLPEGACATG